MKGYNLQRNVVSFSGGIDVWKAEKEADGDSALILRFSSEESIAGDVYHRAVKYAEQLRNDAALLPLLDATFNEKEFACCVAYAFPPGLTPLAEMLERYSDEEKNSLWAMRCAAERLESLHKRRLSGHFLGSIGVLADEEHYSVRLAFIGMAEAFRAHGAGPWPDNRDRSDWTDDIYHLAKCFEGDSFGASSEIVRACCADDKSSRPDYPELLRAMAADVVFRPPYEDMIPLMFGKNVDVADAKRLVDHLNLHDCYVSPWLEKDDGKRECKFCTRGYQGVFLHNEGDRHFFVPHFDPRRHPPSGVVLRAQFEYAADAVRGRSGEYHHLAALGGEKSDAIKEWQLVPEQEKKYIEETAFSADYRHHRVVDDKVNKFAFLLRDNETVNWQQVNELRERQKRLDAVPMVVGRLGGGGRDAGKIYDIATRWIVSAESDKDGIPKEGELSIGDKCKAPFEFCWRDRKEIHFAVSGEFNDGQKEALQKMQVADENADIAVKDMPGVLGAFVGAQKLPEIITVDAGEGAGGIPKSGSLREDVSRETIPFKRQIEAVGRFERGEMAEPLLGGILATPSDYQPRIVPPVELVAASSPPDDAARSLESSGERGEESARLANTAESPDESFPAASLRLFNPMLNDSQKDAVRGALFQQPLFLIQGPPGTGKTTVIVETVQQMLAANPRARILVCSQTNLAVDNVIERLPDKKPKRGGVRIRKMRLAAPESFDKIDPNARPYLWEKRFNVWFKDAINRGAMAVRVAAPEKIRKPSSEFGRKVAAAAEKAGGAERKREQAIAKIVKRWHAFLRNHQNEDDCRMRGNIGGGWLPLKTAFLKSMNVVGATCVHIASARYREVFGDTYDCLIMDEAGKATPAESLIPIALAKQVVLVGDHKQLPPFITGEKKVWKMVQGEAQELEDEGVEDLRRRFGKSLFEELIASPQMEAASVMLNTQRRMPKQLGDLISEFFYDGELQSPDDEEYASQKRIALPFKRPTGLAFVNIGGRRGCHDNGDKFWRQNECSAEAVMEILRCLDGNLQERANVAVIAAYRGQKELLKRKIQRECGKRTFEKLTLQSKDPGDVVNTVDGFQGRENAIVIYDVVRSSSGRDSIGFLDEPRRLNVALSRAQKLLVVVGDAGFLMNRARPGNERRSAEKPILGEIAEKIARQEFVFNSIEEALQCRTT